MYKAEVHGVVWWVLAAESRGLKRVLDKGQASSEISHLQRDLSDGKKASCSLSQNLRRVAFATSCGPTRATDRAEASSEHFHVSRSS